MAIPNPWIWVCPAPPTEPNVATPTGSVFHSSLSITRSGQRNAFQLFEKSRIAPATAAGRASGRAMLQKGWKRLPPPGRAAAPNSAGGGKKKWREQENGKTPREDG